MGETVKVLLDTIYHLHKNDSKTNVCIDIPVEKDYKYFEILCSYTPKNLDNEEEAKKSIEEGLEKYVPAEYRQKYGLWRDYLPVVNLVTLSLDYNGKYLGCAHRHNPCQQHIISKNFSSPGFFKQDTTAGNWRAVLNVHCVASDECDYHLSFTAFDTEYERKTGD
jgi:hypothetical protein